MSKNDGWYYHGMKPPELIADAAFWSSGSSLQSAPRVVYKSNLAHGLRVISGHTVAANSDQPDAVMQLLLPKGAKVYGSNSSHGGDTVCVPYPSGCFFKVLWVGDSGLEFFNNHTFAIVRQIAPFDNDASFFTSGGIALGSPPTVVKSGEDGGNAGGNPKPASPAAPISIYRKGSPNCQKNWSGIEVGTYFRVECPGTILGIRYFTWITDNWVSNVGRLWNASNYQVLASVGLPGGQISGFKNVMFGTKIKVVPGEEYIISKSVGKLLLYDEPEKNEACHGPLTSPYRGYSLKAGDPPKIVVDDHYYVDVLYVADKQEILPDGPDYLFADDGETYLTWG